VRWNYTSEIIALLDGRDVLTAVSDLHNFVTQRNHHKIISLQTARNVFEGLNRLHQNWDYAPSSPSFHSQQLDDAVRNLIWHATQEFDAYFTILASRAIDPNYVVT
jgi:hypothetical protein